MLICFTGLSLCYTCYLISHSSKCNFLPYLLRLCGDRRLFLLGICFFIFQIWSDGCNSNVMNCLFQYLIVDHAISYTVEVKHLVSTQ